MKKKNSEIGKKPEIEIIEIHKRPKLFTIFSIYEWSVTIVYIDGETEHYHCWAGVDDPSPRKLINNLNEQITNRHSHDKNVAAIHALKNQKIKLGDDYNGM